MPFHMLREIVDAVRCYVVSKAPGMAKVMHRTKSIRDLGSLWIDAPIVEDQDLFMVDIDRLRLFDDQRTLKTE